MTAYGAKTQNGDGGERNYNNIKVIGGNAAANRIKGYSSENMVKGVHIKDLVILDKKITSLKDGAFITNPYMEDVTFE